MTSGTDDDLTRAMASLGTSSVGYQTFGLRVSAASDEASQSVANLFPLVASAVPTARQINLAAHAASPPPSPAGPDAAIPVADPAPPPLSELKPDRDPARAGPFKPAADPQPGLAAVANDPPLRPEPTWPTGESLFSAWNKASEPRREHRDIPLNEMFRLLSKPPAASGWGA